MPENAKVKEVLTSDANTVTVNALRPKINALQQEVDKLEPKISALAEVFANDPKVLAAMKATLLSQIRATAQNLHDFCMKNLAAVDSTDLGDIIKLRYNETTRRTRVVKPKEEKSQS